MGWPLRVRALTNPHQAPLRCGRCCQRTSACRGSPPARAGARLTEYEIWVVRINPQRLNLVDTGWCWVKLSAPYETSKTGAPKYEDVGKLAKALVKKAP